MSSRTVFCLVAAVAVICQTAASPPGASLGNIPLGFTKAAGDGLGELNNVKDLLGTTTKGVTGALPALGGGGSGGGLSGLTSVLGGLGGLGLGGGNGGSDGGSATSSTSTSSSSSSSSAK